MCSYNNHAIWILITKLRFWGSFLCNTLFKDNGFTCQLLICWVGNGFIYISHFLSILFFCIIGLSREKCARLRNVQASGQQQLLTDSDNSRAMGSQQTLTLHRQHWGRAWASSWASWDEMYLWRYVGEAQRLLEVCGGESRGCSVGAENLRCVAYYHEYDLNFPTRSPGGSMVKNLSAK